MSVFWCLEITTGMCPILRCQIGFAVSGKASVKDIKILKVKGEDALAPKFFKGKPLVKKTVFRFE